ncbi:MAG: hypothetical protein KY455_08225 [Euryarchaeota archaeon]|nr:hypothetical protein [Euryarchaeota archaeon]
MANIRVPDFLLARLKEAAPPGVPLAQVIAEALEMSGGPEVVRARLTGTPSVARARTARLRSMDHRSVVLEPGQQVALAEATRDYVRGQASRRYDPVNRTLSVAIRPTPPRRRYTMIRGGPRA